MIQTPFRSVHFPRSRVILISGSSRFLAAVLPSRTMTFGRISQVCIRRWIRQASASSGVGTRLFGGRHFTTLQI